jgi:hypothetical protein
VAPDYLRLHRQKTPHSGIAYCVNKRPALGHRVAQLALLWRTTTAEEMVGRVQYV